MQQSDVISAAKKYMESLFIKMIIQAMILRMYIVSLL